MLLSLSIHVIAIAIDDGTICAFNERFYLAERSSNYSIDGHIIFFFVYHQQQLSPHSLVDDFTICRIITLPGFVML